MRLNPSFELRFHIFNLMCILEHRARLVLRSILLSLLAFEIALLYAF